MVGAFPLDDPPPPMALEAQEEMVPAAVGSKHHLFYLERSREDRMV